MSQTAVTVNPNVAFRGLLADQALDHAHRSYSNGSAAAVGFGIAVRPDASNPEEQFDIFSATGQDFLGVLVHQHAQLDPDLAGVGGVSLLEPVSVLNKGRIWVPIEEDIAVGDSVFFRHTSGSGTEIGAWRNDVDTASCDQLTNAVWRQGGTFATLPLALLEVNAP